MGFTLTLTQPIDTPNTADVPDTAGTGGHEHAEWPPHPARVLCALAATAREPSDRSALRWLEARPGPLITVSEESPQGPRPAYATVRLSWSDVAEPRTARALNELTQRMPDGGTWTGLIPASATIRNTASTRQNTTGDDGATGDDPTGDDGLTGDGDRDRTVLEPCDLVTAELMLRVPYPGFLDDVDDELRKKRPAWESGRYRGYRLRQTSEPSTGRPARPHPRRQDRNEPDNTDTNRIVASVYPDILVLPFTGLRPQARLTVPFTEALRSAVLTAAGNTAPPALHGHGADGRPHVAFLALPDVGHPRADGNLLGLAVAIPRLPDEERAAVFLALRRLRRDNTTGTFTLRVPRLGGVDLRYQHPRGPSLPRGITPQRWRRDSRRWVSVTPIVLDRYPKRPDRPKQLERAVLTTLRGAGLPDPIDLQVSITPLTLGAAQLRQSELPSHASNRLFRHIAVTFDRPLAGPVLVGSGRYLGIGLLAPTPTDSDET